MFSTRRCCKMTSTFAGQRRILKYKEPPVEYIRRAVESGTYRTSDEIEAVARELRRPDCDTTAVLSRFRQDAVRGSHVHDYPVEYLILQQYPPVPTPLVPPKKYRRHEPPRNPLQRLTKLYLDRFDRREKEKYERRYGPQPDVAYHGHFYESAPPATVEDYYRRLLHIARPPLPSLLGQKTSVVQKAYAAAVKHQILERTQGLSEEEAMQRVDDLLAAADVKEKDVARQQAEKLKNLAARVEPAENKKVRDVLKQEEATLLERSFQKNKSEEEQAELEQSIKQTVFHADPNALNGMMRWSDRLRAIPYSEWTVGASTALDHWIARKVLRMSEETWQSLLEGDQPDLLARGRDVVAARESLFPETILDAQHDDSEHDDDLLDGENKDDEVVKSIEKILAKLGSAEPSVPGDITGLSFLNKSESENASDADRLMDELQDWRHLNTEKPYDDWNDEDKHVFKLWMKEYVTTLMPEEDLTRVDFDSTREALLSQPPVRRNEAESFWNELQDESLARILLDKMQSDGPPPGASIIHAGFWDLPFDEQLERLLNLGAIRPLLDEYTTAEKRTAFLKRHGNTLLAGVPMEHLVFDPLGPVRASDLDETIIKRFSLSSSDRFRVEVIPYQSSIDMTAHEKSRLMFELWNQQKAGRARYEEKLYKTDRLGLRYSDKTQYQIDAERLKLRDKK